MMKERIIVTMTTYSKRINNIPTVLDTIFNQTVPPDLVVINLAHEEVIPNTVQDYINQHGIEVYRVEDTKVYKKLIPTLKRYPDDCIISIDDDWLYPKEMIEDFMNIHSLYPNFPISGNRVCWYNMQCHCGCASLVKFDFWGNYIDVIDEELVKNCLSDDLVYTFFANKNGHPYVTTQGIYFDNMEPYNQVLSYSADSIGTNGIEKSWEYLTARFGQFEPNITTAYLKDIDSYLLNHISRVHSSTLKRDTDKAFQKGYEQGIMEMQASLPFRVGRIALSPAIWLKRFFKSI
jgi:hypothetical protein